MSEEELYLFDLQGYLVVRDILTRQQVHELNEISDRVYPRDYADGDDSKGRKGIRNARYVSRWDPACQRLIDHPKIVPFLMELLGPKFRIDHDYAMFMNTGSASGTLHGLPEIGTHRYYHYQDGKIRTGLTVVSFVLTPAGPGDGGRVSPALTKAILPITCRRRCARCNASHPTWYSRRSMRGMW